MRRFVIGDIHGAYKALRQVLKRSGFDKETDLLICLGDVVDGWSQTRECVDELLSIKNLVLILGNHDEWFLEWLRTGEARFVWTSQGGAATLKSYSAGVPESHCELFEKALPVYELDGMVFVHGGLNPYIPLSAQDQHNLLWNRSLFYEAYRNSKADPNYAYGKWGKIFIGHTPTQHFGSNQPQFLCNVVAMDTGAGWDGKLTIMNIDTQEFWQSYTVTKLYPGESGRRGINA